MEELLRHTPTDTGMAFVFVQHLDPNHESILPEILARSTDMPTTSIKSPLRLQPDHLYIIAPNTKILIEDGLVTPYPREPQGGPHHPIDALFKTLAEVHGPEAIGVILTGAGTDGTAGARYITQYGGLVIAQDPAEARQSSMPQSAVDSGHVEIVLPLADIGRELARLSVSPFIRGEDHVEEHEAPELPSNESNARENILKKVYALHGVNFAHYKSSTINRRIHRRMAVHRMTSMADYANFATSDQQELHELFEDMLIKVTRFFRDPHVFKRLEKMVFPQLVKDMSPRRPLRIWVPACASGEEVYSLAIALSEYCDKTKLDAQIFGTDVSEYAIQRARRGIYPRGIEEFVSKERLRRFFFEVEGGYQVAQWLRDMCVFSHHDITRDPPFAHIDLISCRNLLIYFDADLQTKVIPLFHYSLNADGYLLLGPSETLNRKSELFDVVDGQSCIHRKRAVHTPHLMRFFPTSRAFPRHARPEKPSKQESDKTGEGSSNAGLSETQAAGDEIELMRKADDTVLRFLAPPGFLVNEAMEIVQYRGDTSAFVAPEHGISSFNLMKIVRSELKPSLQLLLGQANKRGPVKSHDLIMLHHTGEERSVRIRVTPIFTQHLNNRYYLVTFHDESPLPISQQDQGSERIYKDDGGDAEENRIFDLERRLFETTELLRESIEKHDATTQELRAANEEILSSNEELQSTNEELESSKEELQSSNEELSAVNDELHRRNEAMNRVNDDLRNLLETSQIATVMLDRDLRVRRFTPEAAKLFRLMDGDIGRPLDHVNPLFELDDLKERVIRVIESMQSEELELEIPELNQRFLMKIRPYQTGNHRVMGALFGLTEVTEKHRQAIDRERHLEALAADLRGVFDTVRQPLLVLDDRLQVELANWEFYHHFQTKKNDVVGRRIYQLGNGQWDIAALRQLLEDVIPAKQSLQNYKVTATFPVLGERTFVLNAREFIGTNGRDKRILLSLQDVTVGETKPSS